MRFLHDGGTFEPPCLFGLRAVTRCQAGARALTPLAAWQAMLRALRERPPAPGERREFVDWLALGRRRYGVGIDLSRLGLDAIRREGAVLAQARFEEVAEAIRRVH